MSIILQPVRNDTPDTNEFEKEGNCGKSMCINHLILQYIWKPIYKYYKLIQCFGWFIIDFQNAFVVLL